MIEKGRGTEKCMRAAFACDGQKGTKSAATQTCAQAAACQFRVQSSTCRNAKTSELLLADLHIAPINDTKRYAVT
jgi:hypothetical protein